MFSCGSKSKSEERFQLIELQQKTRFTSKDIQELRKRFYRMSEGKQCMSLEQFKNNMGLLGLETIQFLSERLYNILDEDKDGKVKFQEFVYYFDKITNGDEREKAEISYRLIDQSNTGYFDQQQFTLTLYDLVNSWVVMTGQTLTHDVKERLDVRILEIFKQMDLDQNNQISLIEYQNAVIKDPNLLDIFDFIKKGITRQMKDIQEARDQQQINQFVTIRQETENILDFMLKQNGVQKSEEKFQRKEPSQSSQFMKIVGLSLLDVKSKSGTLIQQPLQISKIINRKESLFVKPKKNESQSLQLNNFNNVKSHSSLLQGQSSNFSINLISNVHDMQEPEFQKQIDLILQNITLDQLKTQYKETMIRLKQVNSTMDHAIDRLQGSQITNQKEYIEKQQKIQQNDIIKSQTVLNISKQKLDAKISLHKQSTSGKDQNSARRNTVQFGHQNWNLVMNMMIGIQMAVRSVIAAQDTQIKPRDFQLKYYFELLPRRTGSENEEFTICKFYDYAPQVYNSIRSLYGIDNDDYVSAIGPETFISGLLKGDLSTLQELTSTGKSGSFFYYSADGRFTLKTISKDEFHFFKSILSKYYSHLNQYRQTLIIRIFGMHKIIMNKIKLYIVIMSNVFNTPCEIHQRFDLKGSLYKRTTTKTADSSVARKDLDFLNSGIKLDVEKSDMDAFMKQVRLDAGFFSQQKIIDYSLLLGIHKFKSNDLSDPELSVIEDYLRKQFQDDEQISTINSKDGSQVFFFGVIDILTNFNTKKQLEYISKRIFLGPTISAIPPTDYSERFVKFIEKIFLDKQ